MSTFIAAVVYGPCIAGYVTMLVLIEGSCGRLVRGGIGEHRALASPAARVQAPADAAAC